MQMMPGTNRSYVDASTLGLLGGLIRDAIGGREEGNKRAIQDISVFYGIIWYHMVSRAYYNILRYTVIYGCILDL